MNSFLLFCFVWWQIILPFPFIIAKSFDGNVIVLIQTKIWFQTSGLNKSLLWAVSWSTCCDPQTNRGSESEKGKKEWEGTEALHCVSETLSLTMGSWLVIGNTLGFGVQQAPPPTLMYHCLLSKRYLTRPLHAIWAMFPRHLGHVCAKLVTINLKVVPTVAVRPTWGLLVREMCKG